MRRITILTVVILGLLIQVNTVQAQSPSPDGVGTCILYQQTTWQVKEVFPSPEGTRQRIQDVSDANRNRIVSLSELLKLGEGFGAKIVPCPGAPVTTTLAPQPAPASDVTDIMMSLPIPLPALVAVGVLFVLAVTGGLALYTRKPRQPVSRSPSPAGSTAPQKAVTLSEEEQKFVDLILKDGSTLTPDVFIAWAEQQEVKGMLERFQTMTRLQKALEYQLSQQTTQQQNQDGPERRGQNGTPLPGKIALPTSSQRRKRAVPPVTPVPAAVPAPTQASSNTPESTPASTVKPQRAKRTLKAAAPAKVSTAPTSDQATAPSDQASTDATPFETLGFDVKRADQKWREALRKVTGQK